MFAVIMDGDTPFTIVIFEHQRIIHARPSAPISCHNCGLEFDGVLAFNDYLAVGSMRALLRTGRRIPEDVAVVGLDDIPLASLVNPELTSVAFPLYAFGTTAMRMVQEMASGRPSPESAMFPFELKVRASSIRKPQ